MLPQLGWNKKKDEYEDFKSNLLYHNDSEIYTDKNIMAEKTCQWKNKKVWWCIKKKEII